MNGRSCCASTDGDVHCPDCETPEARIEWGPRSDWDAHPVNGGTPDLMTGTLRARAVAALHATAEHLRLNPQLPVPTSVVVSGCIPATAGDEEARVALVKAFAGEHNSVLYETGREVWTVGAIIARETAGVGVTYMLSTQIAEVPPSPLRYGKSPY